MNIKTLLVSVIMLAVTLVQSPAQITQISPTPVPEQITVNVLGEVNRPARMTLPKGGTLLDAIALAGGFTRMANTATVILIHKTTGDKPDSVKINIKPILAGEAKDILLRDGDTLNIKAAIF
jgi:protein involved in polysaccharide export with SLBB domain